MYHHLSLLRRFARSQPPPAAPAAPPLDPWEELEAWRHTFYTRLYDFGNSPEQLSRSYHRLSAEARDKIHPRELALLWSRVAPADPWARLVYRSGVTGELDRALATLPVEALGVPKEEELAELWEKAPGTGEQGKAQSFAVLRTLPPSALGSIGIERIVARWEKWSRKAPPAAFQVLNQLPEAVLERIEPAWVEKAFLARTERRSGVGALDLLDLLPPRLREGLPAEPIATLWNRCAEQRERHEPRTLLESLGAMPEGAVRLIEPERAASVLLLLAARDLRAALAALGEMPESLRLRLPREAYLPFLRAESADLRLEAIRLLPVQERDGVPGALGGVSPPDPSHSELRGRGGL